VNENEDFAEYRARASAACRGNPCGLERRVEVPALVLQRHQDIGVRPLQHRRAAVADRTNTLEVIDILHGDWRVA
jgi:hypothetical protein